MKKSKTGKVRKKKLKSKSAKKLPKKKKSKNKKLYSETSSFRRMDSRLSTFSKEIENIISNKLINLQNPGCKRTNTTGSIFQDFEKKISLIGTGGNDLKDKMNDLSKQLDLLHKQNQRLISDQTQGTSQVDHANQETKHSPRKQSELLDTLSPINLEERIEEEQIILRSGTITLGPTSEHPNENKFKFENTESELGSEKSGKMEEGEEQKEDEQKGKTKVEFGNENPGFEIKKVEMNSRRRRRSILKNKNMNFKELEIIGKELNQCRTIEDNLENNQQSATNKIQIKIKSCSSDSKKSKATLNENELENRLIQENLHSRQRQHKKGRDFSETLNNIYSDLGKTLDQIEINKLITNADSQKCFDFNFEDFNVTEMENKGELRPNLNKQKANMDGKFNQNKKIQKIVKSEILRTNTEQVKLKNDLNQSETNHLRVLKAGDKRKTRESPKFSAHSIKSSMSEDDEQLSFEILSKFISPGSKRYINHKIHKNKFNTGNKKRNRRGTHENRLQRELLTSQKAKVPLESSKKRRFSFYPNLVENKSNESDIFLTNSNLRSFWADAKGIVDNSSNYHIEPDIPFKSERQLKHVPRNPDKLLRLNGKRMNRFSWSKSRRTPQRGAFSENQLVDNCLRKLFLKIIIYQSKLESLKLQLHHSSGESLLFRIFRHFSTSSGQFDLESLCQLSAFLRVSLVDRQLRRVWGLISGFACVPEIFKTAPGLKYNLGETVSFRQFRLLFGSHRLQVPELFLSTSTSGENFLCSRSEGAQLAAILVLTCKMLGHISFLVNKLQTFEMEHLFHVLEQFESPFDNKNELTNILPVDPETSHSRNSVHFKKQGPSQRVFSNAQTNYTTTQPASNLCHPKQTECSWNTPRALKELDLNLSTANRPGLCKSSQSLLTNVRGEGWG